MRRISVNPAIDPVVTAMRPHAKPFRVGQKPSLIFAPSEVAEAKIGGLHIRLYGLGMLGPNGLLPIYVTEIAREREEHRGDATLSNFLDIFHQRSLRILCRAWAVGQATANRDRLGHDRFSFYVGCLSGLSPRRGERHRMLPHARLAATLRLTSEPRNSKGLCNWIAHQFGVPVSMVQ